MSTYLVGTVTLVYAFAAADHALRGQWGLALVFAGYSMANVGLMVASRP